MSMLKTFFEIGTDKAFFDGLYITQNKVLCEQHLGKYPVIFLSLKDVAGLTFEEAVDMLVQLIGREAKRFSFLQNSPQLSVDEQEQYKSLIAIKNGKHWMDKGLLASSLIVLSQLLCQHYGQAKPRPKVWTLSSPSSKNRWLTVVISYSPRADG